MTNVEALKALYVALGGSSSTVANVNTNAEMIAAIATVLPEDSAYLPAVTSDDNGKILTVVNKSCKRLCARMYGDVSFQLLWVDTKEHDCWIVWSEYGEFLKNLPGFHSGRTMVLLYIPTSND